MAPPPAAGAARRAVAAPLPRPSTRRPPLRIFEPEQRRSSRRGLSRRGQLWLAVAMVVSSLLVVVVGDAMVAQGQVRLAAVQTRIDGQSTLNKALQTQVAGLAAPDRVVAQAISDGLTAPPSVKDLPQVPLDVPLPVPVTTAPVSKPARAAASTTHAHSPSTATGAAKATDTTSSTAAPPTR
jgi:hypothetical protein